MWLGAVSMKLSSAIAIAIIAVVLGATTGCTYVGPAAALVCERYGTHAHIWLLRDKHKADVPLPYPSAGHARSISVSGRGAVVLVDWDGGVWTTRAPSMTMPHNTWEHVTERGLAAAWSNDGNRLALLRLDDQGDLGVSQLEICDPQFRVTRTIRVGVPSIIDASLGIPFSPHHVVSWSADDRLLAVSRDVGTKEAPPVAGCIIYDLQEGTACELNYLAAAHFVGKSDAHNLLVANPAGAPFRLAEYEYSDGAAVRIGYLNGWKVAAAQPRSSCFVVWQLRYSFPKGFTTGSLHVFDDSAANLGRLPGVYSAWSPVALVPAPR